MGAARCARTAAVAGVAPRVQYAGHHRNGPSRIATRGAKALRKQEVGVSPDGDLGDWLTAPHLVYFAPPGGECCSETPHPMWLVSGLRLAVPERLLQAGRRAKEPRIHDEATMRTSGPPADPSPACSDRLRVCARRLGARRLEPGRARRRPACLPRGLGQRHGHHEPPHEVVHRRVPSRARMAPGGLAISHIGGARRGDGRPRGRAGSAARGGRRRLIGRSASARQVVHGRRPPQGFRRVLHALPRADGSHPGAVLRLLHRHTGSIASSPLPRLPRIWPAPPPFAPSSPIHLSTTFRPRGPIPRGPHESTPGTRSVARPECVGGSERPAVRADPRRARRFAVAERRDPRRGDGGRDRSDGEPPGLRDGAHPDTGTRRASEPSAPSRITPQCTARPSRTPA